MQGCQQFFVELFFFSSRRRHTSSLRDWSSDVCSSDLAGLERRTLDHSPGARILARGAVVGQDEVRSEERRVGKECRYRWSAYHYKKNCSTCSKATYCGSTGSSTTACWSVP